MYDFTDVHECVVTAPYTLRLLESLTNDRTEQQDEMLDSCATDNAFPNLAFPRTEQTPEGEYPSFMAPRTERALPMKIASNTEVCCVLSCPLRKNERTDNAEPAREASSKLNRTPIRKLLVVENPPPRRAKVRTDNVEFKRVAANTLKPCPQWMPAKVVMVPSPIGTK